MPRHINRYFGKMKKVIPGFVIAAIFWFLMFSPWTKASFNFWYTMTAATVSLIIYSLVLGKDQLKKVYQFKLKWVLLGILFAAILYGVFFVGKYVADFLFDFANHQIENIYATKDQASKIYIGLALLFLIGPAEEIFWRGFAQHNLSLKYGATKGYLITTAIYTLVHIWSFNFILIMAALICGLAWGWIFKRYKSIWPGLISHAIWDCVIFVVFPLM